MRYALCLPAVGRRFAEQREGKMAKRYFLLIGVVGIFLISVSCAGPSRVEMDYGTSYKLAKFNQTLNPEAEKNLQPVTGFDGAAAKNTLDRYQKDFEKPTPPPTYVLSVGTIGK
jgi:hypothetical protein